MTSSSTTQLPEWSVYQRGDSGAWVVRFKDPTTGKWRDRRIPATACVKTKRQAEAWARGWLLDLAECPKRETSPKTLAEYYSEWVSRRERNLKVRRSTLANNRAHATHYILPKLGTKLISELKPPLMRDYVAELRDGGRQPSRGEGKLAPYTVRNIAATLRAILDEAFDEGLLPANPMRSGAVRRELPKPETLAGRNIVIHLPRAEAEKLLACPTLPDDRYARDTLGLTGGFRDGEIAAFTWADMVVEHEVPHADVNKSFDTNWKMGPPKNDNAIRKVPLHPVALAALHRWKENGFVMLMGRPAQPTDPVFPNEHGKHNRPKSAQLLREELAAAGCPTKFKGHPLDFHALRRSFATWLADAEVPDALRKRLMGHGAAGVTDKHYTAKELRALQKAVQSIALNVSASSQHTDGHAALLAAGVQQGRLPTALELCGSAWESNPPDDALHAAPSVLKTEGRTSLPSASGAERSRFSAPPDKSDPDPYCAPAVNSAALPSVLAGADWPPGP